MQYNLLEKVRRHILLILFSSYHLLLTIIGLISYPGLKLHFIFFSITYYVLIVWNNRKKGSISIVFLSWFLWLGFFQKIVFHLGTNFQFITELIGQFQATPEQWDLVLAVAIFSALGITFTSVVLNFTKIKGEEHTFIPERYPKTNFASYIPFISGLFFLIVLFVAIINVYLGINLSGLVAKTVLIWPMNALIAWLLYMGLMIVSVFLMDWEISSNKKLSYSFLLFVVGAFLCSVSIISRGLFVFHVLPILYLLYRNQKQYGLPHKELIFKSALVVVFFFLNTFFVTIMRNYYYNYEGKFLEDPSNQIALENTKKSFLQRSNTNFINSLTIFNNKKAISEVTGLIINRWIGAEGVMAVVAYPEKGFNLVKESFLRKPIVGELDLYEKIVNTQYKASQKYSFANIPGPAAFLFYANSLLFVFLGFIVFSAILHFFDTLVWSGFKNTFLSGLIGFYLANGVAQFGISPRPLFISVLMTSIGLLVSYWILTFLKLRCIRNFSNK